MPTPRHLALTSLLGALIVVAAWSVLAGESQATGPRLRDQPGAVLHGGVYGSMAHASRVDPGSLPEPSGHAVGPAAAPAPRGRFAAPAAPHGQGAPEAPRTPVTASGSGGAGPALEVTGGFDALDSEDNPTDIWPPDPQLAAGPDHIIEMVNVTGAIFEKDGALVDLFPLTGLFVVPEGSFDFDPKVIYDAASGRFFATYVSYTDESFGMDTGRLHVAVSTTSDPMDPWDAYFIEFEDTFPDYPGLGLANDKVTVSVNLYDIDGPPGPIAAGCDSDGFCGVQTIVMEKGQMLSGDNSIDLFMTSPGFGHFTIRPAHSLSGTADQWMASVENAPPGSPDPTLHLWVVTGAPADGNVSVAELHLDIFGFSTPCDWDSLGPACGEQAGSSGVVDSGDNRLLEAIWRDGKMWVSASTFCGGDNSCLGLIQVDTDALTVLQEMSLDTVLGAFYPAIRTDEDGDLVVAFSVSDAFNYIGAAAVGQTADGALTGYTILKEGETPYEPALDSEPYRWGDYMGAAVDPADPSTIWVVGEYAKDDGAVGWGTWISSIQVQPGAPTPTATPEPSGGLAGDVDCSVGVNSVDSLKILRYVASLSVQQNEPCTDIGAEINTLSNGTGTLTGLGINPGQPARRTAGDVALADGALRAAVSRMRAGDSPGPGVAVQGGNIRVEILHQLPSEDAREVVESHGGLIEGEAPGVLVQALVPWANLEGLEAAAGIDHLRTPLRVDIPIAPEPAHYHASGNSAAYVGEEIFKTNADDWQAAGYTGAGVKVGIVDVFGGALWNAAQAAGELPQPAGSFCRDNGTPCDLWSFGQSHGEGVAEIIHELAPDAQIYVASAGTTSDLQAAVNYFGSQGVDIISRSLTSEYDGPGDGTGPIADVIDSAVSQGMIWMNSAGNSAGTGSQPFAGSYWRSGWNDPNNDGYLDFAPGADLMGFGCGFANGVRWSDWGGNRTDYDVYVFDDQFGITLKATSENDQGGGAPPIENFSVSCGSPPDIDYIAIFKFDAGSGTASDTIEFMTNSTGVALWQNQYSASGPASDSASTGALSVGAIDPALGTTIAVYSSQGPTNDGRIKPDISAAACVESFTFASSCFNGTSAATPVVAGVSALVLDAGLASSPSQLKTWLLNNATAERGAPGADNVYGNGELILPDPPAGPTPTATSSPTPTPTPSSTASPTPTPSAPPSSTPTPTPTPPPGGLLQGDVDCNGSVNSVDALKVLRYVAGLPNNLPAGCPAIGSG